MFLCVRARTGIVGQTSRKRLKIDPPTRTKRYGQAVQYALTSMPSEVGELPSRFNMVENVWKKSEVPDDLRAKLLIPKLTPKTKKSS